MKWFFWSLILLFCILNLFTIGIGVDNLTLTTEMYKAALDAGADAAAKYRPYNTVEYLYGSSMGYGSGLESGSNIKVDKAGALQWFYKLFFRNLSINDEKLQEKLKSYLPMKALVCFDRLLIADVEDNWIYEKQYRITYRGKPYIFTLSDQVYDEAAGMWLTDEDIGLTAEQRKLLLVSYITDELNSFLDNRKNKESGRHYKLVFSINDIDDTKISGITGVNFIVFCEGLPLPSYNPFKKEFLYVYGLGGSEIVRQ